MTKNYPRNALVVYPALIRYEESLREAHADIRRRDGEPVSDSDLFVQKVNAEQEAIVRLSQEFATMVVGAIEHALSQPNPYPNEEFRKAQHRHLPDFAGAGLGAYLTPEALERILASKLEKGTL